MPKKKKAIEGASSSARQPELVKAILADAKVQRLLNRACDFLVCEEPGPAWPNENEGLTFVAKDAAGGCFAVWARAGNPDADPVCRDPGSLRIAAHS